MRRNGPSSTFLLVRHSLYPPDTWHQLQLSGDQDEAVPCAVDVLVVGAEGSTGLLLVRVSGAGFETIPLDYCLSEQSLLPRILTELLEQVDLVLLEALRVQLYEYRPPDRVTVLKREGNRIPWDGEDGQPIVLPWYLPWYIPYPHSGLSDLPTLSTSTVKHLKA